jgi:type I restriction enzyme S subunit
MDKEILIEPLGNIFKTTSGGTPSRKKLEFYRGNIPWVKSGELENNIIYGTEEKITDDAIKNSSAKIFPAGTLLIALYGATIGKLAFLGIKATTNQAVCGIFDNGVILSKYTYYYLLFRRPKLIQSGMGGAQPNISQDIVRKQPFPIIPLPEQRAIVSKIEQFFSDLDNGIDNFKKAEEQLKIYRQAVLKKAFKGELTKKWRKEQTSLPSADELLQYVKEEGEKHYQKQLDEWKSEVQDWEDGRKEGKKPTKPKKMKEVPQIENKEYHDFEILPDNWKWTRLANVVIDFQSNIVDGPFGSNLKSEEYVKEGKPVLMIQNIKANQFIDKKIKYVKEEKFNSLHRHQFINGDLIVTKLGDPLGLCCRVPKKFNEGVIVADLIRIKPSSENINYDWLMYLINSQILQGQFRKITKGTTRPRMNLTIMRNVILPLCSKEEQSQIVQEIETRLSVCDKMETTIAEALQKSEALRQSVLKNAFGSKLLNEKELEEARNAPDWEPAEKLLERIKAKKKNN